jgi:predicted permease
VLARILGIILPVFLIILVGYLYARRVKPDMAMVNRISMTILAPALIFSALASKDFSVAASGPLMLGCVVIALGSRPGTCVASAGIGMITRT